MIKIAQLTMNPFGENTYILMGDNNDAIIVDAGCHSQSEKDRLKAFIEKNNLRPILALNTHAHIDHACGVDWIKQTYGVPFALHPSDSDVLSGMATYGEALGFHIDTIPTVDQPLADGDKITLGSDQIEIIHTPGHSAGGVCIYIPSQKMLITGDTLFCESIGRTDLPTGDYTALMRSIVEKLLPLGGDVTFFPGHGPSSDLMHETQRNPFVSEVLNGQMPYEN